MITLPEVSLFLKSHGFQKSDKLPKTIQEMVNAKVMIFEPPILVGKFASRVMYANFIRAVNRRQGWNDYLCAGITYDTHTKKYDCILGIRANSDLLPYFD